MELQVYGNTTLSNDGNGSMRNISCEEQGPFACVNPHLEAYARWYWGIHGYLSLMICVFGIGTNGINILILTRSPMRTPINTILTAIAICDLLTMGSYIPFASHFYIESGLEPTPEKYSYGWTVYLAVHSNISLTMHALSLWLAVVMAVLRYVYLQTKSCCTTGQAALLCCVVAANWCLLMIPNYMLTGVTPVSVEQGNKTLYRLNEAAVGSTSPSVLARAAVWLMAVLGKLVPCVLISVFIGLLLRKLHESASRRKRLFTSSGRGGRTLSRHQCTTTMLLVIIVMYILTEIPQVVAIVLSALSRDFFVNVYLLLADTLDLIALVNNAINFLLYCTMSQQFRDQLLVVRACSGGGLGGGGSGGSAVCGYLKATGRNHRQCVDTSKRQDDTTDSVWIPQSDRTTRQAVCGYLKATGRNDRQCVDTSKPQDDTTDSMWMPQSDRTTRQAVCGYLKATGGHGRQYVDASKRQEDTAGSMWIPQSDRRTRQAVCGYLKATGGHGRQYVDTSKRQEDTTGSMWIPQSDRTTRQAVCGYLKATGRHDRQYVDTSKRQDDTTEYVDTSKRQNDTTGSMWIPQSDRTTRQAVCGYLKATGRHDRQYVDTSKRQDETTGSVWIPQSDRTTRQGVYIYLKAKGRHDRQCVDTSKRQDDTTGSV
ncbi:uncharacterized protein LOC143301791 [Babylonia areolata]|uniref:uncharacterized protein LOC143301791 n=1 Tax=Babylonia areolata TaxID=304850 RepID=UPI003FD0E345